MCRGQAQALREGLQWCRGRRAQSRAERRSSCIRPGGCRGRRGWLVAGRVDDGECRSWEGEGETRAGLRVKGVVLESWPLARDGRPWRRKRVGGRAVKVLWRVRACPVLSVPSHNGLWRASKSKTLSSLPLYCRCRGGVGCHGGRVGVGAARATAKGSSRSGSARGSLSTHHTPRLSSRPLPVQGCDGNKDVGPLHYSPYRLCCPVGTCAPSTTRFASVGLKGSRWLGVFRRTFHILLTPLLLQPSTRKRPA